VWPQGLTFSSRAFVSLPAGRLRPPPPRSGSQGWAAGLAERRARCRAHARRACPDWASVGCECVVDNSTSSPLCRRHLSRKNSCPVGKHQTREGSRRERGAHPQPHRKDQADLASCCSSEASMEGERREGQMWTVRVGKHQNQTRSHPRREAPAAAAHPHTVPRQPGVACRRTSLVGDAHPATVGPRIQKNGWNRRGTG
jgi:hypothetical protein